MFETWELRIMNLLYSYITCTFIFFMACVYSWYTCNVCSDWLISCDACRPTAGSKAVFKQLVNLEHSGFMKKSQALTLPYWPCYHLDNTMRSPWDYHKDLTCCLISNRPFYCCLVSDLASEWQQGWRRPWFDTGLTAFVV